MIIQTAPPGTAPLAVMMHEHTALCAQFAQTGNDRFESLSPLDLMIYVISNHDATRPVSTAIRSPTRRPVSPTISGNAGGHITVTSRLSPDFDEAADPYCGLNIEHAHWGLYNVHYSAYPMSSNQQDPQHERPLATRMLDGNCRGETK